MYGRIIRLEARRGLTEDPFFVTDELRVHCEIEISLAAQLAQASVAIYNLSEENSKALTSGDHEVGSADDATALRRANKVYIRLYAGYKDEMLANGGLPLLLEGIVMNATSRRQLPNHITQLYVLPLSSSYLRQPFTPFSVPRGTPLKFVLERMCWEAGFENITYDLTDEILNQDMGGAALEPDPDLYGTLRKLGEAYAFSFSQRASGIGFYPKLDDSAASSNEFNHLQQNGEIYNVKPFLLRGAPTAGVQTLSLTMVLDGKVFPGWVIDVQDISGSRGDLALPSGGLTDFTSIGKPLYYTDDVAKYAVLPRYMLRKVIHKLDNYQDVWETSVVGTVPTVGDFGKGEQRG
ncbi:baseplate hub [Aeromonas phage ZPAH14]|uniref:Uncharacterized protein n=1 Tax=Aeromonas phage ZPAH14 TaxID=2924887 RepID=A0AAE9GW67_9CAUD|nr:baseplate hub [Aeromonas phage ZPAH14]UOT58046.1 hypothetical protein [Aeromonas phage ZPAH14]